MADPSLAPSGFDHVARLYRWAEYLTLGPLLTRARNHFLPRLDTARTALLLGDGDGRFTAALLRHHPRITAHAVDSSPAMLALLLARAPAAVLHCADALTFTPSFAPDLIVTHFFLDCLTQPQLDALVARLAPLLPPGALWLLSDFRIPAGALRPFARLYVRALYLAFRVLTGLRATRLPCHAPALRRAGLQPLAIHRSALGLLTSELWQKPTRPGPTSGA